MDVDGSGTSVHFSTSVHSRVDVPVPMIHVNDYLEASGANRPSIGGEETILAHRKKAANRLAIDCIYALSKEELSKVDKELEGIVGDLPRQVKGIGR